MDNFEDQNSDINIHIKPGWVWWASCNPMWEAKTSTSLSVQGDQPHSLKQKVPDSAKDPATVCVIKSD